MTNFTINYSGLKSLYIKEVGLLKILISSNLLIIS